MKLLRTVLPVAVSVVALLSSNAVAQTTLRVVMHSGVCWHCEGETSAKTVI